MTGKSRNYSAYAIVYCSFCIRRVLATLLPQIIQHMIDEIPELAAGPYRNIGIVTGSSHHLDPDHVHQDHETRVRYNRCRCWDLQHDRHRWGYSALHPRHICRLMVRIHPRVVHLPVRVLVTVKIVLVITSIQVVCLVTGWLQIDNDHVQFLLQYVQEHSCGCGQRGLEKKACRSGL